MVFTYTDDEDRKIFSSYLHKLGIRNIVEKTVKSIPWSEYEFNGKCLLKNSDEDEPIVETHLEVDIKATTDTTPYKLLGGAAYSIYQEKYPSDLFMDSTGDIDINLSYPRIYSVDGKEDYDSLMKYCKSTLNKDLRPNKLIVHYFKWLIEKIRSLYFDHIHLDELEAYTDKNQGGIYHKENRENKLHFLIQKVNGESPGIGMLKLVVECKVKGMSEEDHLFEMIIITRENCWETLENRCEFREYDLQNEYGIILQSYSELIDNNIAASFSRKLLGKSSKTKHKLFNHIARLRYLNDILFDFIKDKNSIQKNVVVHSACRLIHYLLTIYRNIDVYNYTKEDNHTFFLSFSNNFIKLLPDKNMIFYATTPRKTTNSSNNLKEEFLLLENEQKAKSKQKEKSKSPVKSITRGRTLQRNTTHKRTKKRSLQRKKK